MPRKLRRARLHGGGLSHHQQQLLMHGFDFAQLPPLVKAGSQPHRTDEEIKHQMAEEDRREFGPGGAAAAWNKHRAELLATCQPGHRPYAFWKFDVLVDPPVSWWQEARLLVQHSLLTAEEELAMERVRLVLDPAKLPAGTAHLDYSRSVLKHMLSEHSFAAEWHRRRGRGDIADAHAAEAERIARQLEIVA